MKHKIIVQLAIALFILISGCLRSSDDNMPIASSIDYANIKIKTTSTSTSTTTTTIEATTTTTSTTTTLPQMMYLCPRNYTKIEQCDAVPAPTTSTLTTTTTTLKDVEYNNNIKIDYQDIGNMRPSLSDSAFNAGFFECKRRCEVDVGMKPPKFSEQPKVEGYEEFYNKLHGNENKTDEYCFIQKEGSDYHLGNIGEGFLLNTSIWNLTRAWQNYTIWNASTIWYNRTTNHSIITYWKDINESHMIWNESGNWFVRKYEPD